MTFEYTSKIYKEYTKVYNCFFFFRGFNTLGTLLYLDLLITAYKIFKQLSLYKERLILFIIIRNVHKFIFYCFITLDRRHHIWSFESLRFKLSMEIRKLSCVTSKSISFYKGFLCPFSSHAFFLDDFLDVADDTFRISAIYLPGS